MASQQQAILHRPTASRAGFNPGIDSPADKAGCVSSTRRFVERADVHSIHLESEVMKIKLYFQEQQFDHLFALFCVKDTRRDGDPSMSRSMIESPVNRQR